VERETRRHVSCSSKSHERQPRTSHSISTAVPAQLEHTHERRCSDYIFSGHIAGEPLARATLRNVIPRMRGETPGLPRWTDPKQGTHDVVPHGSTLHADLYTTAPFAECLRDILDLADSRG
jgi:hypothetical protein